MYSPAGALDAVGGFGRGAAEDADWSTAAINQAHVMLCENYELSGHSSKCPGTLLCRGIHSRPPAPPVQEHCRASSLPCGLPRRAFLLGKKGKKEKHRVTYIHGVRSNASGCRRPLHRCTRTESDTSSRPLTYATNMEVLADVTSRPPVPSGISASVLSCGTWTPNLRRLLVMHTYNVTMY